MLTSVTIARLKKEGVPVNLALPAVGPSNIRAAQEVAVRANILGVFIAIANDKTTINFFKDLLCEQQMTGHLTETEHAVIESGKLTKQQEIDFSWYQESLYAMSWCLGLVKKMNQASQEAELEKMFPVLPPEVELEPFLQNAQLIVTENISTELEYYYGLHWAVKHPESWGLFKRFKASKYKLSVISERRKALEWVCDRKLNWDDIPLNT